MATHSSVLAWRIPGMVEPDGLPSVGSHRVGHDWSDLAAAAVLILEFLGHRQASLLPLTFLPLPPPSLPPSFLSCLSSLPPSFLPSFFLSSILFMLHSCTYYFLLFLWKVSYKALKVLLFFLNCLSLVSSSPSSFGFTLSELKLSEVCGVLEIELKNCGLLKSV